MGLLRLLAVMSLVASIDAHVARAADVTDDLLGEWAPDCSRGPSFTNVHVAFQRENGSIVRSARSDRGASVAVLQSVAANGAAIHLVFGVGEQSTMDVEAEYAVDTSMRTTRSVLRRPGEADTVWIESGVLATTGQPAPTLFKCHDRPVVSERERGIPLRRPVAA